MARLILLVCLTLAGPLACAGSRPVPTEADQPSGRESAELHIAVLPVVNWSGGPAPIEQINQDLRSQLRRNGLSLLPDSAVQAVIDKYRIRYLGGLDRAVATHFRDEAGASAVLLTTLELYSSENPPKVSIFGRLVATGRGSQIIWVDGIGLAGDDAPGLLDLGMIDDPRQLTQNAIRYLSRSLVDRLTAAHGTGQSPRAGRKFAPKRLYRAPFVAPDRKYRIAVSPFYELSERKHAGDFMAIHFARALLEDDHFEVIEPGVIRQALLDMRIIMADGLSLANADLLFHDLQADLILTGRVLDYQDYKGPYGTAKVDFAAQIIERESRRIVWSVQSYNRGDEGVYFFDWGKVNTAHAMAAQMAQQAVETFGR